MIPTCWKGSSFDLQGSSDPDLDFVASRTSKFQVKQSKKKQHLKAYDRNKKEHIYLNVKHSTSPKKQMMRRQRTEENKNITNKDSPGLCTNCRITAVILGILLLALLGTALGFIIKGYPCPRCPEQWVAYRGSCYSFSKQKKDWHFSRQSCRAQGAHLLVISDTSEMDFFQMMHTESYWIGLQNSTGYDWVWEDGSKLNGKKFLNALSGAAKNPLWGRTFLSLVMGNGEPKTRLRRAQNDTDYLYVSR